MPIDMKALARMGAEARLATLQQEVDQIHRAFPDLLDSARSGRSTAAPDVPAGARTSMSAAARKAVSARMRRYWAARRQPGSKARAPGAGDARSSTPATSVPSGASDTPRKRTMSAAARRRIGAAQKKRWATVKGSGKKKR
jgi:hypothetical protein